MSRLSRADQTLVLDAVRELYAELDLDALRERMVRVVSRLVANEWASYNEIGREDRRSVLNFRIPDAVEIQTHAPRLLACIDEHPGVQFGRTGSYETRAISDFIPWPAFQQTKIFNEYYRHVGVRHQLFFSFDGGQGTQRTIALNRRHRDFSERDRAVLGLLSPHFGQAHANATRVRAWRAAAEQPATCAGQSGTLAPLPRLTARENEVLNWIAHGKNNPEIALILGLSVRTVYKHVENIFGKLGVESRAQAMVRALESRS